jgi:hypothetical protein
LGVDEAALDWSAALLRSIGLILVVVAPGACFAITRIVTARATEAASCADIEGSATHRRCLVGDLWLLICWNWIVAAIDWDFRAILIVGAYVM